MGREAPQLRPRRCVQSVDVAVIGTDINNSPVWAAGRVITVDVNAGAAMALGGELKDNSMKFFAFAAPNLLVLGPPPLVYVPKASVIAFPNGNVLFKVKVPEGLLFRAASPEYIIVRPFGKGAHGLGAPSTSATAVNLQTGAVIVSRNRPALDVYGNRYVGEPNTNEVGLYEIGKGLKAKVRIPDVQNR